MVSGMSENNRKDQIVDEKHAEKQRFLAYFALTRGILKEGKFIFSETFPCPLLFYKKEG
jgi:hypothetical protein